ncbi:MAG: hypothetical protein KUG75_04710 [Pseudomonadales bacterium]|nr:hypothetical protein [Pseudomonadales bacterium]
MVFLVISCCAFAGLHIGISSTPLRSALLGLLGENGYLGLYSLIAITSLLCMVYAYSGVAHTDYLWMPSALLHGVTKCLVFVALLLLVSGNMVKNPTAVKMDSALGSTLPGIVKITRHPVQWGILLFALGHLLANGDLASIVLFSTLILVSGVGMIAIDSRKKKLGGKQWASFFASTSLIPFIAIITGRTRLNIGELSGLAIGIAVLLYCAAYWFHATLSGGPSLI